MAFALGSFLLEINDGRLKLSRDLPQISLLVGLFFAAVMSHVANTYFSGMIETVGEVWKICFVTILLFCAIDRPSRLRKTSLLIVVMACVMSIHALMQDRFGLGFIGERPLYIPAIDDNLPYTRSLFFGIFGDPNDLAQMLATSIPFAFTLFRRRTFLSTLIGTGITWLLITALLTTHSRGGVLALAVVGAVMFALVFPSRWLPFLMIVLAVSGLVVCPLSAGYLDASSHDRVVFWGHANQFFKANPVFGIGYNMFWMVAEDRAAHNAFVLCYTELGIFGYWFWFSLLQLGFIGAWKTRITLNWPENEEQRYLRRFAGLSIAAMAGFCVSSYFLSRAFVYPIFFLFVILGVLPVIAQKVLPEEFRFKPYTRRDVFVLCTMGSFLSVFYIYVSILLLNKAWGG